MGFLKSLIRISSSDKGWSIRLFNGAFRVFESGGKVFIATAKKILKGF